MSIVTVDPKGIIFREGEDGNVAYIIQSGMVEILKRAEHGEVQLAILEPGAVLGEMALFEPKNFRSATARALDSVTLQIINEENFKRMVNQCPDQLRTVIYCILMRLRDTSQRLAAKERTTVVLDQSIEQLTISPAGDALHAALQPVTVKAANLPFAIGGYPESEDRPKNNELDLPCDGPPLMISQRHCRIERTNEGVFLVDLGSRFCTIVNGKVIGRAKVTNKAQLQLGENKVTLGDYTSPYKLLIVCE